MKYDRLCVRNIVRLQKGVSVCASTSADFLYLSIIVFVVVNEYFQKVAFAQVLEAHL